MTAAVPKTHLVRPGDSRDLHSTVCGMFLIKEPLITEDIDEADCQRCQAKVQRDQAVDEAVVNPNVVASCRQRAYSRALTRMRDDDREKFDRYKDEELSKALREEGIDPKDVDPEFWEMSDLVRPAH